jgi:type III pantothenate kinase
MLLAVDVGNTETAIGLFDGDELRERFRISTVAARTTDERFLLVEGLLRTVGLSVTDLKALAVSSVVPQVTGSWAHLASSRFSCEALVIGVGVKTGMEILVETPREVGADRIVNAVAAYHRTGCATVVIDLGTAITFDVLDARGRYLGGAIAPGLGLSLDALFKRTAKLPRVDLVPPPNPIGRNTVEHIQSGVFYGAVAMVDGMVKRLSRELGDQPVAVIATGGQAETLAAASTTIQQVEPDLTLWGLHLLYRRNTSH